MNFEIPDPAFFHQSGSYFEYALPKIRISAYNESQRLQIIASYRCQLTIRDFLDIRVYLRLLFLFFLKSLGFAMFPFRWLPVGIFFSFPFAVYWVLSYWMLSCLAAKVVPLCSQEQFFILLYAFLSPFPELSHKGRMWDEHCSTLRLDAYQWIQLRAQIPNMWLNSVSIDRVTDDFQCSFWALYGLRKLPITKIPSPIGWKHRVAKERWRSG